MKKILFLCLISIIPFSVFAQAPSKKCPTCDKSIAACQYKGKHPKTTPTKPTQHATPSTVKRCDICNKPLSQCDYGGKHPYCETCGKLKERCEYKGDHSTQQQTVTTKPTTGTINGHEWVDLGLSVKWATCNVGANSPSDYGGYYAWGETTTKSRYDWNNCFDCLDNTGYSWGTYKIGGLTQITPTSGHDTARENWGGTWRMPTDAENEELCKKCTWTWTSQGGHGGYKITGPNSNSIFLPAAGHGEGTDTYSVGILGWYWSSTLSSSASYFARYLYFASSLHGMYDVNRRDGQCVRPVTN